MPLFSNFCSNLGCACANPGPQGPTGPIGPAGPQGIQGPKGDNGNSDNVYLYTHQAPGNTNDSPEMVPTSGAVLYPGDRESLFVGNRPGFILLSGGFRTWDLDGNVAPATISCDVLENGPYATSGNSGATSPFPDWRVTVKNSGTVPFKVAAYGVYLASGTSPLNPGDPKIQSGGTVV